MKIKLKPQFVKKDEDDKHVLAFDYKTGKTILFTQFQWEVKKGFLMLVVNGEIVP